MTGSAGRFTVGMRVAVCADEAGLRVLRFGHVKRVGAGGASWRLQGTAEWYDAATGVRLGGFMRPHYARPAREGDEALQEAERRRAAAEEAHKTLLVSLRAFADGAVSRRVQQERGIERLRDEIRKVEASLAARRARLAAEESRLLELVADERQRLSALVRAQGGDGG